MRAALLALTLWAADDLAVGSTRQQSAWQPAPGTPHTRERATKKPSIPPSTPCGNLRRAVMGVQQSTANEHSGRGATSVAMTASEETNGAAGSMVGAANADDERATRSAADSRARPAAADCGWRRRVEHSPQEAVGARGTAHGPANSAEGCRMSAARGGSASAADGERRWRAGERADSNASGHGWASKGTAEAAAAERTAEGGCEGSEARGAAHHLRAATARGTRCDALPTEAQLTDPMMHARLLRRLSRDGRDDEGAGVGDGGDGCGRPEHERGHHVRERRAGRERGRDERPPQEAQRPGGSHRGRPGDRAGQAHANGTRCVRAPGPGGARDPSAAMGGERAHEGGQRHDTSGVRAASAAAGGRGRRRRGGS